MSIKVSNAVWQHSEHNGNALILLLKLADNADDGGYCWPGIEYLAEKVRVSTQTIIRQSKELEESGEVFIVHNRRHGNKYVVRVGLSDEEFIATLRKHFEFDDETISNILIHNTCVTSEVTHDVTSEVTHVSHDPSITVKEPSQHVAAPRPLSPQTNPPSQSTPSEKENLSGDALLDAFGIQRAPHVQVTPTPAWQERASETWTAWGSESEEFQRQLARFGERGRRVQHLGDAMDAQFGLRPNWKKPKEVRGWAAGLSDCLERAEDDEKLVLQVARRARADGLTIANPYSLHKMIDAAAAERRSPIHRKKGAQEYVVLENDPLEQRLIEQGVMKPRLQ